MISTAYRPTSAIRTSALRLWRITSSESEFAAHSETLGDDELRHFARLALELIPSSDYSDPSDSYMGRSITATREIEDIESDLVWASIYETMRPLEFHGLPGAEIIALGLTGLWKDAPVEDSSEFVRTLREHP